MQIVGGSGKKKKGGGKKGGKGNTLAARFAL